MISRKAFNKQIEKLKEQKHRVNSCVSALFSVKTELLFQSVLALRILIVILGVLVAVILGVLLVIVLRAVLALVLLAAH